MALLAIRGRVRDYQTWRAAFDALGEVRRDWGVTAESVHTALGAPDTVLALHYFATVAQARGFLTCREHHDAMRRAGSVGSPRIEIYGEPGPPSSPERVRPS